MKIFIILITLLFTMPLTANELDDANAKECRGSHDFSGQEFGFAYCQFGGYTVKKIRLFFYDFYGNEVHRDRRNKNMTVGKKHSWRHSNLTDWLPDNHQDFIEVKFKYWISGGSTRKCSFSFDPSKGYEVSLKIFSNGTTLNGNRCKVADFSIYNPNPSFH